MRAVDLPTPKQYEPLTEAMCAMLQRSFTGVQALVLGIYEIDKARGTGVLDGQKCVWTKAGRRITFWAGHGAMGASLSKEVDPLSDPATRAP